MADIRRGYRRRAGLAAIAFHRCIELVTGWTLGDIAASSPAAAGRRAGYHLRDYHRWAIR